MAFQRLKPTPPLPSPKHHPPSNGTHFIAGNRTSVKFWKDRWCNDSSLNVSFSSLFSLTNDKDIWVGSKGVGSRRRRGLVEPPLLKAFS
ncbi:hypothetical protein CK203_091209 [Vitis vinifera]|uniref:Uncharacterized protein n=1 Tax=Vitis vinifera TaxID=29760 RepID=A0A438EMH1_VITVI|nr:hypothetical protein CK203_091209 [Vitis vinifera]